MVDITRIPQSGDFRLNIGDLSGAISAFDDAKRRDEDRTIAKRQADQVSSQNELSIESMRQQIDQSGKRQSMEDLAKDSLAIRNSLVNGDVETARTLTIDRLQTLNERRKTDPSVNTVQTEAFLQALETDPNQALSLVEGEIKNLTQLGFVQPLTSRKAGSVNQANAPVMLENPSTGETMLAFPTINKDTLEATLEPAQIPQGFELVTETPEQKRQRDLTAALEETIGKLQAKEESDPRREAKLRQASQAAEKAKESFTQIDAIRSNIVNLREARSLVEQGAGTGPIDRLLPSFKAASIALDNMQGRLGLDVVGATTFGALSKGELDLAKAVALPTGLEGPDLIDWIDRKIAAQDEVSQYLERQAVFLSSTDEEGNPNTIADWKRQQKAEMDEILESQSITEDDIKTTMRENNMDRSTVLREIRKRFQ